MLRRLWHRFWERQNERALADEALQLLWRELETVAARYEAMSYAQLRGIAGAIDETKVVDGATIRFWCDLFVVERNGDLRVCLWAEGAPTRTGFLPFYEFCKRPDGTVYRAHQP
ncbi:MAG: hypothetical protein L0210_06150 [Rhodospirillales bacterium]|nr:hypothetical protein [Rhodospirillales bacterium]